MASRVFALTTLVFGLSASSAHALMFEKLELDQKRTVLVIRDCGRQGFEDKECTTETSGFYIGDAARLRRVINRQYAEVWLISGGGVLDEGIKVGEVLREYQATVRVPRGYRCVSACTVAFMGGFFRIVDDGATYEVHAASSFLYGFDGQEDILKRLNWNPQDEYARFANQELADNRALAARLLTYFQRSLVRPGTAVSNENRLQQWRLAAPPSRYLGSSELAKDAERYRREGVSAAQETLMKIERESMQQAIEELQPLLPELGPRAEAALRMLDAMYSSRITLTASLSRETLMEMGYVTLFVDRPR
jgi:hypothetical protein